MIFIPQSEIQRQVEEITALHNKHVASQVAELSRLHACLELVHNWLDSQGMPRYTRITELSDLGRRLDEMGRYVEQLKNDRTES